MKIKPVRDWPWFVADKIARFTPGIVCLAVIIPIWLLCFVGRALVLLLILPLDASNPDHKLHKVHEFFRFDDDTDGMG